MWRIMYGYFYIWGEGFGRNKRKSKKKKKDREKKKRTAKIEKVHFLVKLTKGFTSKRFSLFLLNLMRLHIFFWYFHCWVRTSKYGLGESTYLKPNYQVPVQYLNSLTYFTIFFTMLKNDRTYFNNLAVFTSQNF